MMNSKPVHTPMSDKKDKATGRVVKILFEDEVRKYRDIHTYTELILAIARTLGYGVLNCRFMYVDDDQDEITVSNDEDLQEAFNFFEPKPPRLNLITYDEKVDLSLSNVKLCDSMISDDAPKPNKYDSESSDFIEDRPKQVITESSLKRPAKDSPQKDQKAIVENEADQKVDNRYSNSDNMEKEHEEKLSEVVDEVSSNILDPEVTEDRIRAVVEKNEQEVEEKNHSQSFQEIIEERIKQCEEVKEDRPKIASKNSLDFDEIKSKVSELIKLELSTLLPEMLKQSPTDFETLKFQQEQKKYANIVHEGVKCNT
jgi:hypothetical protein